MVKMTSCWFHYEMASLKYKKCQHCLIGLCTMLEHSKQRLLWWSKGSEHPDSWLEMTWWGVWICYLRGHSLTSLTCGCLNHWRPFYRWRKGKKYTSILRLHSSLVWLTDLLAKTAFDGPAIASSIWTLDESISPEAGGALNAQHTCPALIEIKWLSGGSLAPDGATKQ